MNTQFEYTLLDLRPVSLESTISALKAKKEEGFFLLGLEVATPNEQIKELLDMNIDPQHTGQDVTTSATAWARENQGEIVRKVQRRKKVLMVFLRVDLDALAAAVVAKNQLAAKSGLLGTGRIAAIDKMDCFKNGPWEPQGTIEEALNRNDELGAMFAMASDFKAPIEERVKAMETWLLSGDEPAEYRKKYEAEKAEILAALKSGETQVFKIQDVVFVKSSLRAATTIGYTQAPIVVALNPAMPQREGDPIRKYTICQYGVGYLSPEEISLQVVAEALNSLEEGWGGSPTIIGSPQGQSSTVTTAGIWEVLCNFDQTRFGDLSQEVLGW